MADGAGITFVRRDTDWHTVADEREAFYLRIAGAGQYRYPGADLGIMVTRGRFMDERPRAAAIAPARGSTASRASSRANRSDAGRATGDPAPEPFGFKML